MTLLEELMQRIINSVTKIRENAQESDIISFIEHRCDACIIRGQYFEMREKTFDSLFLVCERFFFS